MLYANGKFVNFINVFRLLRKQMFALSSMFFLTIFGMIKVSVS